MFCHRESVWRIPEQTGLRAADRWWNGESRVFERWWRRGLGLSRGKENQGRPKRALRPEIRSTSRNPLSDIPDIFFTETQCRETHRVWNQVMSKMSGISVTGGALSVAEVVKVAREYEEVTLDPLLFSRIYANFTSPTPRLCAVWMVMRFTPLRSVRPWCEGRTT